MRRDTLVNEVESRLAGRNLVWFGTRGEDIESIADLESLSHAFSLIAPYRRRASIESWALEDASGRRLDLDTYDLDDHPRDPAVIEMRSAMLRALARPSAVVTYRPSSFLSAVAFARQDRCRYIGLFKDHQAAFEHKPWVESEIASRGVPHIPWIYVADDDQLDTVRLLDDGPIMLRRSRTNGGVGLVRVDHEKDLSELWFDEDEAYVSVAPFIEGGVPVNVGAVVWPGRITVHPASVQLIGVPGCTTRPYGYCGNDFGSVLSAVGPARLTEIEESVVSIGQWLRQYGYLGAFGVDFLVTEDAALFTEVNPRFQGSTHLSCQVSTEAGESCLLLEHLAALLGCGGEPSRPLVDQARDMDPLAHLVVHWDREDQVGVDPAPLVAAALAAPETARVDVLTRPELLTERCSTVARITIRDTATSSGFAIAPRWEELLVGWATQRAAAATTARSSP